MSSLRLWLKPTQIQELVRSAQKAYPQEACGLLVGIGEEVREVIALPNIARNPEHHYRMDDRAYGNAIFQVQKRVLSVIGFYHSHPNSDPIPSQEDIRDANYPETPYLIIGLRHPDSELAAWQIRYGQVTPVEIHVSTEAPAPQTEPLSQAQKRAIILSAIIAFAFMIILSLSLLPPAPIIITPVP